MSTDAFQLDTARTLPALNYLKWMQQALESGKGLGSMLKEMTSLQLGRGKLLPEEYFLYQLYDDERYTPEAKRTFIGSRSPVVQTPWAAIVKDKPTLTALLRGMDFPIPATQAIVHPERSFGGAQALHSPDDVRRFLREDADYPIFGKPFDSACSLGTANITAFDHAADAIVLSDGRRTDLDAFIDQLRKFDFKYLFQSLMRPHPALVPIVGDRVCTVRMFVLQDEEGCALLRASWKIPADENGADNFWRPGNLLAGIDVESGKIVRTLQRTRLGVQPIDAHPRTGASFQNLVFPQWQAMRALVLQAAPNLPGCHLQGWDVALTDRGPVLVELEGDGGDPIMEQLCFDTGLLQGRFLRFVESRKEVEKQEKAKRKAKQAADLKRNFASLAPHPACAANEADDADEPTAAGHDTAANAAANAPANGSADRPVGGAARSNALDESVVL